MINIYIYSLKELDAICSNLKNLPLEMDLHSHFTKQLCNNYNIVSNINDANIAFIPIDFTKLIYLSPLFSKENLPQIPSTYGVYYKKKHIKYYWNKYVLPYLNDNHNKIPHFILYSYVLFEIDFSDIPKNIYILSYENKVSLYNQMDTYNYGTFNRIIVIPYVLNNNPFANLSKINTYYFKGYDELYNIYKFKKINCAFFGSIANDDARPLIYESRSFLLQFKNNINNNVLIESHRDLQYKLPLTKYLFVLRGDTPTRMAFYQCFAYGIVPIIYEKEKELYKNLIISNNINLFDSCLIIPNKNDNSDEQYYNIVNKILYNEFSNFNNYLNKIKNHHLIFDSFNYFKEPLSEPIKNSIDYLMSITNKNVTIINKYI